MGRGEGSGVRRSHCAVGESCESHIGEKLQVAHGKKKSQKQNREADKSRLLEPAQVFLQQQHILNYRHELQHRGDNDKCFSVMHVLVATSVRPTFICRGDSEWHHIVCMSHSLCGSMEMDLSLYYLCEQINSLCVNAASANIKHLPQIQRLANIKLICKYTNVEIDLSKYFLCITQIYKYAESKT